MYRVSVVRIIPFINVWLHVIVTWDQRLKFAKIIINGTIGARKVSCRRQVKLSTKKVCKIFAHFDQNGRGTPLSTTTRLNISILRICRVLIISTGILPNRVVSLIECSNFFKTKPFRFQF